MKIAAFAFEKCGFEIAEPFKISFEFGEIHFISAQSQIRLDSFSGVIFPSQIFERFVKEPNMFYEIWNVEVDSNQLLQRDKEVSNLIQGKGWFCCLTESIVDSVPQGRTQSRCNDTDLSKRILNRLKIGRDSFSGATVLSCKRDEFRKYGDQFGVAKTRFNFDSRRDEIHSLFQLGNLVVGFEANKQHFFLPFHTANQNRKILDDVVTEISKAIINYRQKTAVDLPKWAEAYKLPQEVSIEKTLDDYFLKIEKLKDDLAVLKNYKGILVFSGELLKNAVVSTLRNLFLLHVSDEEYFKEDALIYDEEQKRAVIEIKGTTGGIKRAFISQLDANRERIGLAETIPGVLIINDQMDITSIERRREVTVPSEQIKFAASLNITIIQTSELWFSLLHIQQSDLKNTFYSWISKGGGRLIFENGEGKIIT